MLTILTSLRFPFFLVTGYASLTDRVVSHPNGRGSVSCLLDVQTASYYTRDEFLELEPVIVTSLDKLLRTYLKVGTGARL